MTDDVVHDVVVQYARLAIPGDQVTDATDLYQAGMTSHASVTVMLGLENALDIEFPDELQRKSTFTSIAAIRAAIAGLTD